MPYKRRYAKKPRRRRRKTYRRRRKKAKSSMWKTAIRAAQTVVKKKAQPLFVRKVIGNYNTGTGQFDNPQNVQPGPDNGWIDPLISEISLPSDVGLVGTPGYRRDMEITITGIKLSFRVILPQNQSKTKFKAYLYLDKLYNDRRVGGAPLQASMFKCPDEFFMLRTDEEIRSEMQNIRVLAQRSVTINSLPNSSGNNQSRTFRDFNIWWKPRKGGFKYKYTDTNENELLNRAIGVCVKCSQPENPAADTVPFGLVMTTYYRDYS